MCACVADKLLANRCNSISSEVVVRCPSGEFLQVTDFGSPIVRCCPFKKHCSSISPEMWEAVWEINRLLREASSFYEGYKTGFSSLPSLSFLNTLRVRCLLAKACRIADKNNVLITTFKNWEIFLMGGRP